MPLNVHVNIVGEWAEVSGDMVQSYLEQFDNINCVLAQRGLPAFMEPDFIIDWDDEDAEREYMTKFPFQCLDYLKRAFVLRRMMLSPQYGQQAQSVGSLIPPVGPEGIQAWLDHIHRHAAMQSSHLLFHSDSQGVYLPMDEIVTPIVSDNPALPVPGHIVGSSTRLLEELMDLAPGLGIGLTDDGRVSAEVAAQLCLISNDARHPYCNEICAWFALHQSCELSIKYQTAIVFASTES